MTMIAQERPTTEPGGRDPAPGALALVQAFLNSTDLEEGWDRFSSPEALRDWLVERGLLEASVALTDVDLSRALAVREAIREVLYANNGGEADAAAVATLNDYAAAAPLLLRFDDELVAGVVPGIGGLDGALARLFAIILAAQIDGTWPRLKACRNDVCRWAFYDASKNRSGHWCTMAICGSRRKTRAYRARRREG
ncbi:MAG: CGNR zinc finger domain-containing protein [Chloroflexia bacterium]